MYCQKCKVIQIPWRAIGHRPGKVVDMIQTFERLSGCSSREILAHVSAHIWQHTPVYDRERLGTGLAARWINCDAPHQERNIQDLKMNHSGCMC